MFPVNCHLLEVCSLSRRVNLVPYPCHYSKTFAFSSLLYPLVHRFALRLTVHRYYGDNWAYPVPPISQSGLAPAYSPGELSDVWGETRAPHPYPSPFWFRPSQHLWPVIINDVYQRFTSVAHTTISSSHPA